MSQINTSQNSTERTFWRSLSQLNNEKETKTFIEREFPEDASILDKANRRDVLKLMGGSFALAGLTGCTIRRPVQKIRPYVSSPENFIPGKAQYFATSLAVGEDVVGVLAKSHEGRPTKLEGNPNNLVSKGALKSIHQAEILNLYDPDRVQEISEKSQKTTWENFEDKISNNISVFKKNSGSSFAILTTTEISPTIYRKLNEIKEAFPKINLYKFDALNRDNQINGIFDVSNQKLTPTLNLKKANVIVSFDSDFLGNELDSISNSKGYSSRRSAENKNINRLYCFESSYSITGTKADHRVSVKSANIIGILTALTAEIIKKLNPQTLTQEFINVIEQSKKTFKTKISDAYIKELAIDLIKNKGNSLILSGYNQPKIAHSITYILNQLLSSSEVITYRKLNFEKEEINSVSNIDALNSLVTDIKNKKIDTLLILGGNPVYTAPGSLNFSQVIELVKNKIHLTQHFNNTSAKCDWILPESHFLESWGDATDIYGGINIVQPLIQPLYDSKTKIEVLNIFLNKASNSYAEIRKTLKNMYPINFNSNWKKWLHEGIVTQKIDGVKTSFFINSTLISDIKNIKQTNSLEVTIKPAYSILDGRYSNNAWLQETPDPITKLTWDNAAIISNKTAKKFNLKNEDVVTLKANNNSIDIPVYIIPGQAENSISISLGYGQQHLGRINKKTGFNIVPLIGKTNNLIISNVSLEKTEKTYKLASTQEHGSMEGRPIYREGSLEQYEKDPKFAKEMVKTPPLKSLWDERKYDTGYQWGMAIDLSKCTGCAACTTACQAENNIPIVGKSQVLVGREMHWIRIDRYFEGDENNAKVYQQPMTCLQCENAPCEQVCPVAATTHSKEGLNDMVYNRCIGTRYCSNNCPVKVRRFNFFDYHQKNPQSAAKDRVHLFDYMREPEKSVQKQFNPDVTVRMRGVMEKCTYCVQRINQAKYKASNEKRTLSDGEIVTACQQTCPSNAIVFGNILDKNSLVYKTKRKNRDYHLLEELHLKARTSFLASISNPNPKIQALEAGVIS